jgi:trans-AT polyketide synthase, acyltransferase and oxidoreductase domains
MNFTEPFIISATDQKKLFPSNLSWHGNLTTLAFDEQTIHNDLLTLDKPVWAVTTSKGNGLSNEGEVIPFSLENTSLAKSLAWVPSFLPQNLGDPDFCRTYGTRYALYGGAMANGIASEEMVIALGNAGFMGSFGAGGLVPERIEAAIQKIQSALYDKPYAFNLLNSPGEPALERRVVELYLKYGIKVIEASAYLVLTANLVWYRVAGLSQSQDGKVVIGNHVIAKISRKEIAKRFLEPAPAEILKQLVQEGKISELQASLAQNVPMADDITVEADSGGHTDNRPLVGLIPAMLALRDQIQDQHSYPQRIRIGAAGGIGTPSAALAAFQMGAAYVVTGSVNHSCVEANTSEHTKKLLGQAEMTDMAMAPAGDMFEMGVKVQVLKRGTMFAMRAQRLYEIYSRYDSLEDVPLAEREKLETQVFKRSIADIWNDCDNFFRARDPKQIERALNNPKDRMALVFRWYLGLSSRWSVQGEKGREMDYQIWCGPAMGTFNDWVRDTYLQETQNRFVVDVARQILTGCAYLYRIRLFNAQGLHFQPALEKYIPHPFS